MELSCAFQPIIDVNNNKIFSYEALVRGINNESAEYIFSKINNEELMIFDQLARNKAIQLASSLNINCFLQLNFLIRSIQYSDKYILETAETAVKNNINPEQIIIEITEKETITEIKQFKKNLFLLETPQNLKNKI